MKYTLIHSFIHSLTPILDMDKWEELNLEQQSTQSPLIDKLSIPISDLRISGNPENQSDIPEEILFTKQK